jgi:hypothetical protein
MKLLKKGNYSATGSSLPACPLTRWIFWRAVFFSESSGGIGCDRFGIGIQDTTKYYRKGKRWELRVKY